MNGQMTLSKAPVDSDEVNSTKSIPPYPETVFQKFLSLITTNAGSTEATLIAFLELRICPQVLASLLSWFFQHPDFWPSFSEKALEVLSEVLTHPKPSAFFEYSGNPVSPGISLPPISRWPLQNGWSFNCWLYLSCGNERPFIYCFFTNDGSGFSAHLENESLVLTTIRQKDKGFRHQIVSHFAEHVWYMLSVVYIYNRWGRGEICVYVNGDLRSRIETSWYIMSDQPFTRCSIGGHYASSKGNTLVGRLTNVMGFLTSLTADQVYSIYSLGVDYQGQFRFEADCTRELPEIQRRQVYGGSLLYNQLLFAYTPAACDPPLLLNRAPRGLDLFVHSAHAIMNEGVQAVTTAVSIPDALHSLGGMQAIYPLFERIDLPIKSLESNEPDWKTTKSSPSKSLATQLLHLVLNLVRASPLLARQLVQTRGLLLFATALRNASSHHLTMELLTRLITAARNLIALIRAVAMSGASVQGAHHSYVFQLIRHLHGYMLCNPDVWIRAPLEVQDQLYQFLTTEFLPDLVRFGCVHRTSTVIQSIHTLKHYFCLIDPRKRSGYELKTPNKLPLSPAQEVLKLRANLLIYLKQLVARQGTLLDAEMQALLNYLLVVEEDENLHDVLYLLITLLVDTPNAVGATFVRNDAIHVAFKRLSVLDESNRVYAIKLLGFHLHFSRLHKYDNLMDRYGLFDLMIERLHGAAQNLSVLTYNALFEVLIDSITSRPQSTPKSPIPADAVIQQPQMLRVISELIYRSERSAESTLVRQIFLQHLLSLCTHNTLNRRTVLQLSVWQDCLLRLTPLQPESGLDAFTLAITMRLFRALLFHAIRYEREGWRVWIDTLALLHMWLEKSDHFNTPYSLVTSSHPLPSRHAQLANVTSSTDVGLDLTEPVARQLIQSELSSTAEDIEINQSEQINSPMDSNGADVNQSVPEVRSETVISKARSPVRQPFGGTDDKSSVIQSASGRFQNALFLRDFRWSPLHQLLLDDLLCSIEEDLGIVSVRSTSDNPGLFYPLRGETNGTSSVPASPGCDVSDHNATSAETRAFTMFEDPINATFAINLIHLLSDCADILISASGGLLPLLAAASTATGEIGTFETVDGMTMSDAMSLTLRVAYLLDLCILHVDLHTIEKQRSMASGTLVRQFARLYLTTAVRDTLESRFAVLLPTSQLVHQLKMCTDLNDGVRFVTCPMGSNETSQIQSYAEPELRNEGHHLKITDSSQTEQQEADIILSNQSGGSTTGSTTSTPVAVRSLASPTSRADSEQLAQRLLSLVALTGSSDAEHQHHHRLGTPPGPRLGLCPFPWRFVRFLSADQVYQLWEWKQQYEARISYLPNDIQRLLYALRPTLDYPCVRDKAFVRSVLQPRENVHSLLQVRDLNRLQGVIFKSEEIPRVPEFLALSAAYFLSVLMVSKYRDILEPSDTFFAPPTSNTHVYRSSRSVQAPSSPYSSPNSRLETNGVNHNESVGSTPQPESVTSGHGNERETVIILDSNRTSSDETSEVATPVSQRSASVHSRPKTSIPREKDHLTETLNTCLSSTASFLRDLFGEFHAHFAKHLLGSQGQVLLNTGAPTLRESQSVIELVMLLCSQEWQSSLQKNAGLAFIELINEGRVMCRATQEHIVRVTQEAIVLLNRLSADGAQRHALFGELAAQVASQKREDDRSCDQLIEAARRRDQMSATLSYSKIHRLMNHVWCNRAISTSLPTQLSHLTGESPDAKTDKPVDFYRLDCWEDDSRRRRRFSPNPYGSTHASAVLFDPEEQVAIRQRMLETRRKEAATAITLESMLLSNGPVSPELRNEQSIPEVPLSSGRDPTSPSRNSFADDNRMPELEDFIAQYEDGIELTLSSMTAEDTVRFSVPCVMVSFGIGIHGTVTMYKSAFQFERDPTHPVNRSLDKKVLVYIENTRSRWSFAEIQAVFCRRYLHRTLALEIFVTSRSSVFLAFDEVATLQRVVNVLPPVGIGAKYGLPRSRSTTMTEPSQLFIDSNMTTRWQRRELSNFDYLMYLNTIAGRTYNDMNQYPIFPWILTNYTAAELDLNEPSNYRDLSKPIGALDPKRKAYFDERYVSWDDDTQPPFHYGTHYSTAAFVLGYLLRIEPFTTLFLALQGGKFDHPDRTFFSVGRTWDNCQRSTSDVKELIPEFFYLPEMFENPNKLDLGLAEDGTNIGTVELPPWANTPEDFVRMHRQALESDLVSCQLHHWIDLIFGYKQRGPEAVQATNVFHHLTYDGSVDWSKLSDPVLIKAVEDQIQSFGQTPAQLLQTPHPHRNSALHLNPMMFSPLREELCMVHKFYSNSPVVFLAAYTNLSTIPQPGIVSVTANRTLVLSRWNCAAADSAYQSALIHPSAQPGLRDQTPERATFIVNASAEAVEPGTTEDNRDSTIPSSSSATNETESNEAKLSADRSDQVRPGSDTHSHVDARSLGSVDKTASTVHREPTSRTDSLTPVYPVGPIVALPAATQPPHVYTLGDDFDQTLITCSNHFTCPGDNRALISCGYDDCSFRVFAVDTGRLIQAVFGHFATVTCLAHSGSQSADFCYVASGSGDCTVKLWIYNTRRLLVLGNHVSESASPLVTLIGHEAEVTAVSISSELGLVLSGSKGGTCLLHNTRGTLLRQLSTVNPIDVPYSSDNPQVNEDTPSSQPVVPPGPVQFVLHHREGYLITQQGPTRITLSTLNGKVIRSRDLRCLAATSAYRLTAVLFSACGRYLLVSGTDGVVWVLHCHNLAPVHDFPRCDAPVRSLALSADQHYVLVGLETGSLVVFYIDFGRWHHEFQERYAA
ncbi:Neurobeachin [Fasciola hepatica]|uniref:Neurobeachin n=1 Tax=Fasciola hepatica TaxID=6192 RepID=A0A4E0RM48_FASHE|nr:Neurobeachin [Fasciola hepatica]